MARERPLILDDDEPPAPKRAAEPRESPRFGFEWGLASTIIGATLVVAGPMALVFCLIFWSSGNYDHRLSYGDLKLAQVAGIVTSAGALLLTILGMIFAVRGLGHARRAHQPAALPVTGLFLSFSAFILWIIVGVDLVMIFDSFLNLRDF